MLKKLLFVLAIVLTERASQAALFSGPSFFSTAPNSQLGLVTNNLLLTDNANGFVVSQQALVALPAGAIAGTLIDWVVDRPLDPTYGTNSLFTTTFLDGFSQPPGPPVNYGNTSGAVLTEFTNYPGPPFSQSSIPMTLANGYATWTNISVNSSTGVYTSGGVNFLRQHFFLDGVQFAAGGGGNWMIDVPVGSFVTVVPEPSTGILLSLGALGALIGRRLRHPRNAA